MNKWYGEIGFAEQIETAPGVWGEKITPHYYYGDIVILNKISILADPFTYHNFHLIRYVEFMGNKWKASIAEVQYPRLILTLGDVYHDNE